jgi:lactam utilization protein B
VEGILVKRGTYNDCVRVGVLQVPIVEEDKSNSLMYQLQALFGFLQESERQYYETRDLCHAYR